MEYPVSRKRLAEELRRAASTIEYPIVGHNDRRRFDRKAVGQIDDVLLALGEDIRLRLNGRPEMSPVVE